VFEKEDLETVKSLGNELNETGEYYPNILRTTPTQEKRFDEDGYWGKNSGRLLITDFDDRIIGLISHFQASPYMEGFEVGYQIFRGEDRGKGYMSEALRLYAAVLFDMFPIQRLQLCTDEENIGSWKVAEKCGFQYEGYMRNVIFEHGEIRGSKLYSMIREEADSFQTLIENI
jgi:RimJ/RimL family protein N-acetyltransferase